jgi:hypothetical protein
MLTARRLRVPLPSAATADQALTVARGLGYETRDVAACSRCSHSWQGSQQA